MSDEEDGGNHGAKYLVENHANQFAGVRYAIGEFGSFSFYIEKKKFYPIMVAEKFPCGIEMTLCGPSGHTKAVFHGGVIAKVGQVLQLIEKKHLPVHITTATREMLLTMSKVLPFPLNLVLRQLLNPMMSDRILNLF